MENKVLFFTYIGTWIAYLVFLYWQATTRRLRPLYLTIFQMIPSFIAVSLTYIFLIGQEATVRQFGTGGEGGTYLWSLWLDLWTLLLLAASGAGIAHLFCIVIFIRQKKQAWIPVAVSGALISLFAFFTVWKNFPDM